jgi:membrane protease YdiL (CAAX protease family)
MDSVTARRKQQDLVTWGVLIFFAPGVLNGFYNEKLYAASTAVFWLLDVVHFVVLPSALLIYFRYCCNLRPADYGFIKPGPAYPLVELLGSCVFTAIFMQMVYSVVHSASLNLFYMVGYLPPHFGYSAVVPDGLLHLPVVIYLAVTAGFSEEVMFRGVPYKLISDNGKIKHKNRFYILSTSVLFAAIHWEGGYPDLVAAFAFGVLAAWFYLTYKNIWPLIGAHFLVDAYAFW